MGRYKKGGILLLWTSAKANGQEKRFMQIGNSLLLSKTVQRLEPGARWLYFCMVMEAGGRREFLFPQSAGAKYGIAPSSLRRYLKTLRQAGMIRCESMKTLRKPNRYAFCSDWKRDAPDPPIPADPPGNILYI